MPERALEEQRLEHRRVQPPVRLGMVRRAQRRRSPGPSASAATAAEVRVDVAELTGPPPAARREPRRVSSGSTSKSRSIASASAACWLRVEAAHEAVRGEDREPRVLERDEAHQHVAVRALAADLIGVHARGLVAVVAVGDQQLGAAPAPRSTASIAAASATRQSRLTVPSSSVDLAPGASAVAARAPAARRRRGPRRARRSGRGSRCVARVSRSRSSFGPGWVRSCGRIRPAPYSPPARARGSRAASAPRRRGRCSPARAARARAASSRTSTPSACQRASSSAARAYGSAVAVAGRSMRTTLYGERAVERGALRGVDHVVRRGDEGCSPPVLSRS